MLSWCSGGEGNGTIVGLWRGFRGCVVVMLCRLWYNRGDGGDDSV